MYDGLFDMLFQCFLLCIMSSISFLIMRYWLFLHPYFVPCNVVLRFGDSMDPVLFVLLFLCNTSLVYL